MARQSGRLSHEIDNEFMTGMSSVKRISKPHETIEEKREIVEEKQVKRPQPQAQPEENTELERTKLIDLDNPEYIIVVNNYKHKKNENRKKASTTIYMQQVERDLLDEIAQSYNLTISQLVRSLIVNLKKRGE